MSTPSSSIFGDAFMAAIREAVREKIRRSQAMANKRGPLLTPEQLVSKAC